MPKNARADETKVHTAATATSSLRTTIPSFIASSLELKKGDTFRWKIEGDKLLIEIIKSTDSDNNKSK